ncbi:MAG: hypothetical protein ACE5E5_15155 [Phycisphaerae bacterium]
MPARDAAEPSRQLAEGIKERLAECAGTDDQGRPQLTVTLPDGSALDNLADSLARLLAASGGGGDEAIIVTKSRKATNLAPVEGRLSGRTSRSVGAYKTR